MMYTFEYWWRFNGGNDKDFDVTTITADNLDKAKAKVLKLMPFIFKIIEIK